MTLTHSLFSFIDLSQNKKAEPVYGADILRFWVGAVDYWNDTNLGPVVLNQAAEAVRKIRTTARFILGNIGSLETRRQMKRVQQSEMGFVRLITSATALVLTFSRQTAMSCMSCTSWNKPLWRDIRATILRKVLSQHFTFLCLLISRTVIASLSNFANITLSSLYFDISKDGLYANTVDSLERRAVVTVLEQVRVAVTPPGVI
jgi:isoleucyl-tRNA synthetase